jgi:polysaccharide deacetylase family protein (PEP-CTERM system associated)
LKAENKQMLQPFHLLTIDVEDWPQSALNHALPVGDRVVANTSLFLKCLAEAGVRATFFVLGKVAEAHPKLAREIAEAGHEIGTHGYSHDSIDCMPINTFKEELHRSVEILRDQTGQPVLGHRAADFSISSRSLHLLECLGEEGLAYDSSIFPIRHPRYGVSEAWRHPHYIRCASGRMLTEFPIATIRFSRMILPGAGGGYFRLFPFWWTDLTMRRLEREGAPATCYFHPYELDVTEMRETPHRVPFLFRLSQSVNRRSVRNKLRKLLSTFRFVTMREAYEALRKDHLELALDLGTAPSVYRPEPKAKGCFSPAV